MHTKLFEGWPMLEDLSYSVTLQFDISMQGQRLELSTRNGSFQDTISTELGKNELQLFQQSTCLDKVL